MTYQGEEEEVGRKGEGPGDNAAEELVGQGGREEGEEDEIIAGDGEPLAEEQHDGRIQESCPGDAGEGMAGEERFVHPGEQGIDRGKMASAISDGLLAFLSSRRDLPPLVSLHGSCYTDVRRRAMPATILVVEDETLVGLEIKESLERMGYSVPDVLASGDEVLSAVMRLRPDLVLMDIHLKSYIDGIDVTTRLRMVSSVPVIYMTAYPARSVEDRALGTHPADYLEKPIDDERLRLSVEKALASPSPSPCLN